MKNVVLKSVVLLALLGCSTDKAQGERRLSLFVAPEIGFVNSPEDVTDYYGKGFGASLGLEYSFSPQLSLVWMANYKSFSPDEESILEFFTGPDEYPGATNISIDEGTLRTVVISVLGKVKLKGAGSSFWPYLKGGFGLTIAGADEVFFDYTDGGGNPMTTYEAGLDLITASSVVVAFGLELKRGGSGSFFAEVGYEILYLENEEGELNLGIVPIRVGVSS